MTLKSKIIFAGLAMFALTASAQVPMPPSVSDYPQTNTFTAWWTQSTSSSIASNNIYVFTTTVTDTNIAAPLQVFSFMACTSAVMTFVQNAPGNIFVAVTALAADGSESDMTPPVQLLPGCVRVFLGNMVSVVTPILQTSDMVHWTVSGCVTSPPVWFTNNGGNEFFGAGQSKMMSAPVWLTNQ